MSWSGIKSQCKPLNNREDIEYATGCMKKKAYLTKKEANRICRLMQKRYHKQFNAYPCKFGHNFHIGSLNEANT